LHEPKSVLTRGDRIGVVAPGYAVRSSALNRGVASLRRMGYEVSLGEHVNSQEGYLAGTDDQRVFDLCSMLRDPEVQAVWFARGGYGTARLLASVPWRSLTKAPKLLIGYSDLTALFNPVIARTGQVCLYAPVVSELGDTASFHRPSLKQAISGRPQALRFFKRDVLAHGAARGRLMGGNLTVLTSLCGTRFAPDLRGSVLFLEETGEQTFRIDRMLNQLSQAGFLKGLAGIVLGAFAVPPRTHYPPDRTLSDVFDEFFGPLGIPVVGGLPVGHLPAKRTIPLGAVATLDTRAGAVRFA
jgi:muramoyltetrapeptide carboxypeptidase